MSNPPHVGHWYQRSARSRLGDARLIVVVSSRRCGPTGCGAVGGWSHQLTVGLGADCVVVGGSALSRSNNSTSAIDTAVASAAMMIAVDIERRPNTHRPMNAPASAASTMVTTSDERARVTADCYWA
jgi:hypothetical protein